jgi:DNA-binding transcriptional MocR family regulator
MKALNETTPLYLQIANQIEHLIRNGTLQVGDRVPSIRALKQQQRVSVSTILQAYFLLENRGWIEPKPQSGFYVRLPYSERAPEPEFQPRRSAPTDVGVAQLVQEVVNAVTDPSKVPFGAATANPALYPNRKLNQLLGRIARQKPTHSAQYDAPAGVKELRRQIARRSLMHGCSFTPDEIVITCGAMEALHLALRAVAVAGDVIAIESPTYFGKLQIIESFGMKAIEIPTHPRNGMDLAALENAIRKHRVRACMTMTNCHNPLGYVLPNDYKKDLVALTAKHGVALIEDDVYGDLTFDGQRPKTAKSFDRDGLVLLCSSFSKVLAPGFRVGWIQAGRFQDSVERLKFITTLSSPTLPQLVIAEFIQSGGYDRFLRRLRGTFGNQVHAMAQAIARYFPAGTKVSRPAGGFVLWVELPEQVDSMKLYRAALASNISIVPGIACSPTGRFTHHVRISCGQSWSPTIDRALQTLGKLAATSR